MQDQFRTGSVTVDRMSRLHISGNIIPVTWYKTIRKSTGKPNLNAIIILADIVYWYRPTEVRDEMTGELVGLKKKFHADLLQRSYQQIADQFGITKRDATNAVVELEKMKVIRRVFRTLHVNGQQVPNVLFLDLNVDILEALTYPDHEQGYHLNGGIPLPEKGDRYHGYRGEWSLHFGRERYPISVRQIQRIQTEKFSTESSSCFKSKRKSGNRFLMGL